MAIYKLRHESSEIPDYENGVYLFKLRFPMLHSIGINNTQSEEMLSTLVDTIEKFSNVVNKISVKSRITNKSSLMLMNAYNVTIDSEPVPAQKKRLVSLIENKSIGDLKPIIKMLQFAVSELPPIYVGIAEKQSFKQRYTQHFNGESNFKEGIESLGVSWEWLNFVTFPQMTHNIGNHREVEQLFHLILKPLLSRR